MWGRKLFSAVLILVLVIIAAPQHRQAQGQGPTCEQLVSDALSEIGTACAGLGPNSICYGYANATATVFEGQTTPAGFFAQPGYKTDLGPIETVSTSLFNTATSEWGIAVMNAQIGTRSASANRSTVYLMVGDVQVTNLIPPADARGPRRAYKAPMQEFELATGADSTACMEVLPSSLVVQTPQNVPATIIVNGVKIEIASTVILRAPNANTLQVITGNGGATLFPNNPSAVQVPAGVSVEAIFGDDEVAWQNWRIMSQAEWDRYASLENVPRNIFPAGYTNPSIIVASGAGAPPPQVQLPGGITRPTPPTGRPYPIIPMHTGRPGRELERDEWEAFTIGNAVCTNSILFNSNRDVNWDIFQLDLTGADALNITQSAQSADIQPTYSADGEWVAFVSNRDPVGSWEIYVARTDGSALRRMTFNTAIDVNPVWGPGNILVFESNRDRNWELYMVDVAGDGVPVRLTDDPANDLGPFWYPDGEHIVFESDRDGDWELYQLNILTGEVTQLTDNDSDDTQPVVAHDGSKIAWLQTDDDGVDNLWVLDLDTGVAEQLTDTGFSVMGPVFAPDDTFLAYYAATDQGDTEIFTVDVETGQITALTNNAVNDGAPTFWCQTSQVIYQSIVDDTPGRPGQYELFIVDPSGGAATRLTFESDADDIFAVNDPTSESNSRPNLILDAPIK